MKTGVHILLTAASASDYRFHPVKVDCEEGETRMFSFVDWTKIVFLKESLDFYLSRFEDICLNIFGVCP